MRIQERRWFVKTIRLTPRAGAVWGFLTAATLGLFSGSAQGDTAADAPMAEALFQKGTALLRSEKYAEACPLLEESQKLDPGAGTALALALCMRHVGRTATAWTFYHTAAALSEKAQRVDWAKSARKQIEDLAPELAYLSVSLDPEAAKIPGITVLRDETSLSAALGTEAPIDPGIHRITATAEGYLPFSTEVQIHPKDHTRVSIPPLVPKPIEKPIPQVAPAAAKPVQPPRPSEENPSMRTAGVVIASAGAIGLAAGAVLAGAAKWSNDQAQSLCPLAPACNDPAGLAKNADALWQADVATGLIGGGAAVSLAGILLYTLSPGKPRGAEAAKGPVSALRAQPIFSTQAGGILIQGTF